MKKAILNLGNAINKEQQREITGGYPYCNLELYAMCQNPYGGGSHDCCAEGTCQYVGQMNGGTIYRCLP